MKNRVAFAALFVTLVIACEKDRDQKKIALPELQSTGTPSPSQPSKLLWISLDGMKHSDLVRMHAQLKSPHPKGIGSLLAHANWQKHLRIANPTITASSHVSTITCTPPGVHGIIANSQYNGEKIVSGFAAPFKGESFTTSLRQHNIVTATIGYPGQDGTSEQRTASFGITYDSPDSADKVRYLEVPFGQAIAIKAASRVNAGQSVVIEATASADGKKMSYKLPDGSIVEKSADEWANLQFVEGDKKEELNVLLYGTKNDSAQIYVGATGINQAFPADFRKRLDDAGIVFSNAKDYSMPKVSDALYLKGMEHRLGYFSSVARFVLDNEKPQALFLYFEDLDTLGHQFKGNPEKEAAQLAHFTKFDQAFGDVMSRVTPDTDVVVMGDHGMTSTQYELNSTLLFGKLNASRFMQVSSGGALFLYGKDKNLQSAAPVDEAWFQDVVAQLRLATVEFDGNKPVFAKVVVKGTDEAKALGLDGDDMPWVFAFANEGVGIRQSVENTMLLSKRAGFVIPESLRAKYPDPIVNGKLVEPLYGTHGQWAEREDMMTSLLMYGPHLDAVAAGKVESNLQVVPSVADALGFARPSGCAKPE